MARKNALHPSENETDGAMIKIAYAPIGTVELFPGYRKGLKDIEGFSHLILLYHFNLSKGAALEVTPFLDNEPHGVFATRSPRRPNPIGFSVVKLLRREKNILHIEDVDIVDGTPVLDIKPYIPSFDSRKVLQVGWLANKVRKARRMRSDDRFR